MSLLSSLFFIFYSQREIFFLAKPYFFSQRHLRMVWDLEISEPLLKDLLITNQTWDLLVETITGGFESILI